MATFGNIKNKILVKLTESYGKEDFKGNLNTYFKPITKSDTLKEMYSLYEELEGKTFEDKETATLYVEELSKILKEKHSKIQTDLDQLNESLSNVEYVTNSLYESIDSLSTPDNLSNISDKVIAKKYLVEHLTKVKTDEELTVGEGVNESLLNSVLVNNFNAGFDKTLNEEDKGRLKEILSLNQEDLETKFTELTESINSKLDSIVESDVEFKSKSEDVKTEINEMNQSKYNLYRLEELLDNLLD
tara:strand:+ start:39242 stop:39976 length:735 start_codon:yes stop_codon:yes gene_type:complete